MDGNWEVGCAVIVGYNVSSVRWVRLGYIYILIYIYFFSISEW